MVTLLLWTVTEALLSILVYLNCLRLALCIHMKTIFVHHHYSLDSSKKMGCSHAIFLLRSVMGFYVSKGTTLNIAFLDLSKAFDKVSHNILFQKLMQRNVLGVLVKLLHSWYCCCSAVVRWGHNIILCISDTMWC